MMIRCNECKYYTEKNGKGTCNKNNYPVNGNGFCIHAEKKGTDNGKKD